MAREVIYTIQPKELELVKARFLQAQQVSAAAADLVNFIAEREGLQSVQFNLENGEFSVEAELDKDEPTS
jgi:hypothetical protein